MKKQLQILNIMSKAFRDMYKKNGASGYYHVGVLQFGDVKTETHWSLHDDSEFSEEESDQKVMDMLPNQIGGSTPLVGALKESMRQFEAYTVPGASDEDFRKFVIVITDGVPTDTGFVFPTDLQPSDLLDPIEVSGGAMGGGLKAARDKIFTNPKTDPVVATVFLAPGEDLELGQGIFTQTLSVEQQTKLAKKIMPAISCEDIESECDLIVYGSVDEEDMKAKALKLMDRVLVDVQLECISIIVFVVIVISALICCCVLSVFAKKVVKKPVEEFFGVAVKDKEKEKPLSPITPLDRKAGNTKRRRI